MNASGLFVMPPNLPEPVQELLTHLKETGTGKDKLYRLAEAGRRTKGVVEFLSLAKGLVGEVTWNKISDYINNKQQSTKVLSAEVTQTGTEPAPTPSQEDSESEEVVNPVKDMNAADAIAKIHENLFTKDELEAIILSDDRTTVGKAAQKKLEETE